MSNAMKSPEQWLVEACRRGVMHLVLVNRLALSAGDVPLAASAWATTLANAAHLTAEDSQRVTLAFQAVAAGDGEATPRAVIRALPARPRSIEKFLPKPGDRAAEERFLDQVRARFPDMAFLPSPSNPPAKENHDA